MLLFLFTIAVAIQAGVESKSLIQDNVLGRMTSNNVSRPCREKIEKLLDEVMEKFGKNVTLERTLTLDAGKMFDAWGCRVWGKAPSGLLTGNSNMLGSEKECVAISNMKHCILATDLALFFPNKARLANIVKENTFDWEHPDHR